jgi:hypothetical protein
MKKILLALPLLGLSCLSSPATADQDLWCAVIGGHGEEVCSFRTLAECREAISEAGGVCSPNLGYNRRDAGVTARHHRALRF